MERTFGEKICVEIQTPQRNSQGSAPAETPSAGEEFPRHIGKAFALGLSDSIGVLCVETHFSVLVDDLRVQREKHIFLKTTGALPADARILHHGRATAVPAAVPSPRSVPL